MRFELSYEVKTDFPKVTKQIEEAVRLGLRDTIVAITHDVVAAAPPTHKTPWTTGHNRRSIAAEVSGMGVVEQGPEAEPGERMVDDDKLEAAVYSTSGYGGYLETGTRYMAARPYFRPALDKHRNELVPNIKKYLEAVGG